MEQTQNVAGKQTLVAYHTYWTTMPRRAEPFWLRLDLTISQIKCLILLEVRREVTVGGIEAALGMCRPAASVLVDQMVQRALATRTEDPADRRRTIVCLTEEGRELADRLHGGEERSLAEVIAILQPQELSALTVALNALTVVVTGTAVEGG